MTVIPLLDFFNHHDFGSFSENTLHPEMPKSEVEQPKSIQSYYMLASLDYQPVRQSHCAVRIV